MIAGFQRQGRITSMMPSKIDQGKVSQETESEVNSGFDMPRCLLNLAIHLPKAAFLIFQTVLESEVGKFDQGWS